MIVRALGALSLVAVVLSAAAGRTHRAGAAPPSVVDSGTIRIHLLGHAIGAERFELRADGDSLVLDDRFAYDDRGGRIELASSMRLGADLTPIAWRSKGRSYRFVNVDAAVDARGGEADVRSMGDSARVRLPARWFVASGYAPLEARALLVGYWERHGRPRSLATVPGRPMASVRVERRGVDTVRAGGRVVALRRYAVDGVAWGREALWLDERGRFAAIVTRANMLPLEGVREELADAFPALRRIAIDEAMRDLARAADSAPVLARGAYALTGARLVDGTGRAPVDDAVVVVRDGHIEAAGPRSSVRVPTGMRRIDARGTTILPGLWDMHAHVGLVEWGPAYLGVGVTTVRDMGGERDFLVAMRDAIDAGRGPGPRMLLAGLVDGPGPEAFGTVTAATPDEGRAVVDAYHAAGFEQMKLYTLLAPDVVGAVIRRAHALGMTVTGHVPRAMTLEQLVDSGIDHVAHLAVRGDASADSVRRLIARLAARRVVVDPTISWEELLGRASETPVASFQPAFRGAPWPIVAAYGSVRNTGDSAAVRRRLDGRLAIIRALHQAGVTIVAGTDYGVPGASLLRELELYVRAGLSPMDAIRAATAVSAEAMGMAKESGTIEAGKRADLVVLDRDPLADIANIRSARLVMANGVLYRSADLWRAAGFQ